VYNNAQVYGDARLSLNKSYTKGFFLSSSDNNITPVVIDQSKEDGFDSDYDYKNLLVIGDYEISKNEMFRSRKPLEVSEICQTLKVGGDTPCVLGSSHQRLDEILARLHQQYEMQFGMHKQQFNNKKIKQAITSLIKELVEEAKPPYYSVEEPGHNARHDGIEQYETNLKELLKELEEL